MDYIKQIYVDYTEKNYIFTFYHCKNGIIIKVILVEDEKHIELDGYMHENNMKDAVYWAYMYAEGI